MTNYREILRLSNLGIQKTKIAAACGCSRNTVASVVKRAGEQGIRWEAIEDLNNAQLSEKLFPAGDVAVSYKMPDYEYVHREMAKSGVTLSLLWAEYYDACRETGEVPYKSTQFNKYYGEYVQKTKATMHITRKPGEILEVDWAGQHLSITDTVTGEAIKAPVFVAVLPYSGYAYVEAFLSQDQEAWISAHTNAYAYFGGVTRILTPDNLKTGITRHGKYEVVVNKAYQELAEHYGTAIIPTRVRAPRDKAVVEGSVGVISTWIIAALRNQQFLSLHELNQSVAEKLWTFNHKPFQKKDGSRASVFEEEKLFLLPLPERPYELAVWKVATVQYNYHVSVDFQNYSVPYEYIKQKVNLRITKRVVEIFFEHNRIASHQRLYGRRGQYSTTEAHMPQDHKSYITWNGERFIKWAEKIGEHTAVVVRLFLTRNQVEQQGYKSCMALLKLADTYSDERLERACARSLTYTERPSLKTIQVILKSGQDRFTSEPVPDEKPETPSHAFTRGPEYYQRGDK